MKIGKFSSSFAICCYCLLYCQRVCLSWINITKISNIKTIPGQKIAKMFASARRDMRDEDFQLVKYSFEFADNRRRGYLNREDLQIALVVALGYKPSKSELDNILAQSGVKESELANGFIDSDEMVLHYSKFEEVLLNKLQYCDVDEEIRETFQLLDAKFKGYIDLSDFERTVKRFLPKLDSLKIRRMFNEADGDGDGRVSFRDFQMVMEHQK